MDWHSRFLQQAAWTSDLRSYLFERAGLNRARRVLEVGCGTGAVLAGISTSAAVHGVDLDLARLMQLRSHAPASLPVCGDALALPYPSAVFDITFCHFFLLWVSDPLKALSEIKRITRPGGTVLALAEPDYLSRRDRPEELAQLGRWQADSLRRQGADPGLGRRLAELFHQAGIRLIETGPLRTAGASTQTPPDLDLEWAVLESDLEGWISPAEIARLKLLDRRAWERGERVLNVPTYFAWGDV